MRTRGDQRAPCTPGPRGQRGESLLHISGPCVGYPASPRRREPRSRRQEGAGSEPAPESQSREPRRAETFSYTDPLAARGKGFFASRSIFKDLKADPNISC